MLAVIKTGGKQYLVTPDKKIRIEKVNVLEGKEVEFPEVLFVERQNNIEIGTPLVEGVKVVGRVLRHGKNKKVIVFKYKSKTRYKKRKGHRQPFTEVIINKITAS